MPSKVTETRGVPLSILQGTGKCARNFVPNLGMPFQYFSAGRGEKQLPMFVTDYITRIGCVVLTSIGKCNHTVVPKSVFTSQALINEGMIVHEGIGEGMGFRVNFAMENNTSSRYLDVSVIVLAFQSRAFGKSR